MPVKSRYPVIASYDGARQLIDPGPRFRLPGRRDMILSRGERPTGRHRDNGRHPSNRRQTATFHGAERMKIPAPYADFPVAMVPEGQSEDAFKMTIIQAFQAIQGTCRPPN